MSSWISSSPRSMASITTASDWASLLPGRINLVEHTRDINYKPLMNATCLNTYHAGVPVKRNISLSPQHKNLAILEIVSS